MEAPQERSADPVLEQYEAYPYPPRDPRHETKGLYIARLSSLTAVNHYLFGGRRDFTNPFRALVAGGGTGDATIMLAQQLKDRGGCGEVVYLDISTASRRVVESRAEVRGLTNIRFLTASLTELPDLGLGRFDYIDCCGVLHHLEDPLAGLRALVGALAEGGGLGLMVYGELGRTGVYPVQSALRTLGRGLSLGERVGIARRLLANLPETNWLRRNPLVDDHKRGDAELVDLCLHSRDRAYLVRELVDLLAAAGLTPVSFIEPIRYEPTTYLHDPVLIKKIKSLSSVERACLAEALAGNLKTHLLYAAPSADSDGRVAWPEGPDAVPLLSAAKGRALVESLRPDLSVSVTIDGLALRFFLPRLARAIVSRIDGQASLGQIHADLRAADPELDWPRFKAQFDQLYKVLNGLNALRIVYPGP